jgi:hypothetical protein
VCTSATTMRLHSTCSALHSRAQVPEKSYALRDRRRDGEDPRPVPPLPSLPVLDTSLAARGVGTVGRWTGWERVLLQCRPCISRVCGGVRAEGRGQLRWESSSTNSRTTGRGVRIGVRQI